MYFIDSFLTKLTIKWFYLTTYTTFHVYHTKRPILVLKKKSNVWVRSWLDLNFDSAKQSFFLTLFHIFLSLKTVCKNYSTKLQWTEKSLFQIIGTCLVGDKEGSVQRCNLALARIDQRDTPSLALFKIFATNTKCKQMFLFNCFIKKSVGIRSTFD